MKNPRKHIETLRTRTRESDKVTDSDRELLLTFSDDMDLLKSVYTD